METSGANSDREIIPECPGFLPVSDSVSELRNKTLAAIMRGHGDTEDWGTCQ